MNENDDIDALEMDEDDGSCVRYGNFLLLPDHLAAFLEVQAMRRDIDQHMKYPAPL